VAALSLCAVFARAEDRFILEQHRAIKAIIAFVEKVTKVNERPTHRVHVDGLRRNTTVA
jgi:hypothetical protein